MQYVFVGLTLYRKKISSQFLLVWEICTVNERITEVLFCCFVLFL